MTVCSLPGAGQILYSDLIKENMKDIVYSLWKHVQISSIFEMEDCCRFPMVKGRGVDPVVSVGFLNSLVAKAFSLQLAVTTSASKDNQNTGNHQEHCGFYSCKNQDKREDTFPLCINRRKGGNSIPLYAVPFRSS